MSIVGLSGGVDSAVAALLLKDQRARRFTASFMSNWEADDDTYRTLARDYPGCTRAVAAELEAFRCTA